MSSDKRNKIKDLMSVLKEGWFPHSPGDELYDLIIKRKCKILSIKEPFRIFYPELSKEVVINSEVLFKRFINISQIIGVRSIGGKGTWVEKVISDSEGK